MTDADQPWQVLLLGGASGVGKTTLSTALARHFGVSVTQIVYEPDERQIMANYASREPGDQSLRAHRSWLHSEWLRNECDRRGVPAIAARPWDTVLDRAVEAIGS